MSGPELRVLLVLGEPAHLDVLARRMARRGVGAVGCASVAEALRALRHDEFHCALLDLALPVPDGLEPLTALRAVAPEMPLVLLAAQGMPGPGHGACQCLAGPCGLEEILDAIGLAVASRSGRKEPRAPDAGQDTRAGSASPGRDEAMRNERSQSSTPEDQRE